MTDPTDVLDVGDDTAVDSQTDTGRAVDDQPSTTLVTGSGNAVLRVLGMVDFRSKVRDGWRLLGDKLGRLGRNATSTAVVSLLSAWLIDQYGLLRQGFSTPDPVRGPDGRPIISQPTPPAEGDTVLLVELLPTAPLPRFLVLVVVLFALYLIVLTVYYHYHYARTQQE